jgi:FkbM family methyltransferase
MDMHPGVLKKFWSLNIRGTIHAGAHKGEESGVYRKHSFGPVIWIEAIPELAQELETTTQAPNRVINATLWSRTGEKKPFSIANASGSSSLFEMGTHLVEHPNIRPERVIEVTTTTLDDLALGQEYNLLVLDLQGAEFQALEGAFRTLTNIDYIVSEVNRKNLYQGIKLIPEIDRLLDGLGFVRVATRWTRHGWGEALFIKSGPFSKSCMGPLGLRIKIATYWLWLHLPEIPLVYVRKLLKKLN